MCFVLVARFWLENQTGGVLFCIDNIQEGAVCPTWTRSVCQQMLVEQVLRLQVDKLAMIVSYTAGMNTAMVVFLKEKNVVVVFFSPLSFYMTFAVMRVHVSPALTVIPCEGGAHLQSLSLR